MKLYGSNKIASQSTLLTYACLLFATYFLQNVIGHLVHMMTISSTLFFLEYLKRKVYNTWPANQHDLKT